MERQVGLAALCPVFVHELTWQIAVCQCRAGGETRAQPTPSHNAWIRIRDQQGGFEARGSRWGMRYVIDDANSTMIRVISNGETAETDRFTIRQFVLGLESSVFSESSTHVYKCCLQTCKTVESEGSGWEDG